MCTINNNCVKWKIRYLSSFFKACYHNDDMDILFPHHPPEVFDCADFWSLCGDVLPWVIETLGR
jgi:hypothetical protein